MKILDKTIPAGRSNLARVVRHAPEIFRIDDVESILSINRTKATGLVSRWSRQGWLRRVGPGTYVAAQLGLLDSDFVLEDPWILIPALFSPAYVGGWSAAEYWSLTDQVFRPIVVMTSKSVRERRQTHHGTKFVLRSIQQRFFFGQEPVWRSNVEVLVSDIHRTVIDLLDTPSIGGGIQHVIECVNHYLRSERRNDDVLLDYAIRFDNGAVFKRLGLIAEHHDDSEELVKVCSTRLTRGNAKLDPTMECPRLVSKWHLWIPSNWSVSTNSDQQD